MFSRRSQKQIGQAPQGIQSGRQLLNPALGTEAAQMTTRQEMVGAALCYSVITETGSKLQSAFMGHTAFLFGYFPATYKCKNILAREPFNPSGDHRWQLAGLGFTCTPWAVHDSPIHTFPAT